MSDTLMTWTVAPSGAVDELEGRGGLMIRVSKKERTDPHFVRNDDLSLLTWFQLHFFHDGEHTHLTVPTQPSFWELPDYGDFWDLRITDWLKNVAFAGELPVRGKPWKLTVWPVGTNCFALQRMER